MFHLTLEQGHGMGTMLAILAGSLLLTAWFYRRAYGAVYPDQWHLLFWLRAAALLVVILLWFRPIFSVQRTLIERPKLLFLIDTSASMSIADDAAGNSRLDQARSRLIAWHDKLGPEFELHWLAFADTARLLKQFDELNGLEAKGQATSLSRALIAASRAVPTQDVEALLVLSDGIHNSAGNPLKIARLMGVPVHTIGTGNPLRDSRSYRDIRVTGLDCPDQLALESKARVTGYVDAIGFAGRVVKAQLQQDQEVVAEAELVLDEAEGPQPVAFEFVPAQKGLHTYTVRVPAASEEKIEQNNQRSTSALVVEAGIRVLYIEGTLRAEYGALVGRFLSRDPDLEYCSLIQTRPNVFTQRSNIEGLKLSGIPRDAETLDSFDVFMLGDLDSSYLKPEQMSELERRVRGGAGLLMMGGYHSLGPGGYGGTALEKLLPVFVGSREIGQVTEPFLPVLTPEGRQHPVFANIIEFFPSQRAEAEIQGLPPLLGCTRVKGPKPGASVLAICPLEGENRMPVLAVQPFGDGRVAVFTGDTTRRWQQTMRAMDKETPFLRFWGQLVRWLAGRTEAVEPHASIVATTDKAYYEPESPVTISAVVRDKEGKGASQVQVTARITGPGNRRRSVNFTPVPGPAGHFRASFEPQRSGRYEIVVEAKLEQEKLTADKLAVDVGRPNLEFDQLELNDKLLTAIANESGGRYCHIDTADRLIDDLRRKQHKRQVEMEIPLSWPPLFWTIFVGILTTEWVLRRRYALR